MGILGDRRTLWAATSLVEEVIRPMLRSGYGYPDMSITSLCNAIREEVWDLFLKTHHVEILLGIAHNAFTPTVPGTFRWDLVTDLRLLFANFECCQATTIDTALNLKPLMHAMPRLAKLRVSLRISGCPSYVESANSLTTVGFVAQIISAVPAPVKLKFEPWTGLQHAIPWHGNDSVAYHDVTVLDEVAKLHWPSLMKDRDIP